MEFQLLRLMGDFRHPDIDRARIRDYLILMMNTAAAESLRSFAVAHGELQFAHLVTAALAGEEWALGRVNIVIFERNRTQRKYRDKITLDFIRATDTTRPDGALARSFAV